MESLIKKNNLISMKVPQEFMTDFDNWRIDEGTKNKIEISRSMGFNLFKDIIPYLDLNIKSEKKGILKPKNKIKEIRINLR